MRIAITGTSGRVGRALADRLAKKYEVIELPRSDWDLADLGVAAKIASLDFDVLLHPAAVTSLEVCEDEPGLANRVNTLTPVALAEHCRDAGRWMVFFSTDYVFGGDSPELKSEDAPTEPRSLYAHSKWAAEQGVLQAGGAVVRVSWVFGRERPAFPDMVIDKAVKGQPLAAIADKTSLPCLTDDLAEWMEALVEEGCPTGVFHACQGGEPTSWHGMAELIVAHMAERGVIDSVPEIAIQKLDEMEAFRAVRPRHTAMSTQRLAALLGRSPRDWREALRDYVDERIGI